MTEAHRFIVTDQQSEDQQIARTISDQAKKIKDATNDSHSVHSYPINTEAETEMHRDAVSQKSNYRQAS